MSQHEEFDQLKMQFIADTEAYVAIIKNLSFNQLLGDNAGHVLTHARSKSVKGSIQLSDFISRKRLRYFDNTKTSVFHESSRNQI